MQHTTNYNLNQWDADDRVTREDCNADNAKIDAALKTVANAAAAGAKIATGSYVGTGAYGSGNKNSLTFSFQPKLVVIGRANAMSAADTMIMVRGQGQVSNCGSNGGGNYCFATWSGNSVSWYATDSNNGSSYQMNISGFTYYYIAIG